MAICSDHHELSAPTGNLFNITSLMRIIRMKKIHALLYVLFFSGIFVVTNALSGEWVRCADEGQHCNFSGAKRVKYGTDNKSVEKTLVDGAACESRVFGEDPDYGKKKICYYYLSWVHCANEGSYCSFSGTRKVRYGANNEYTEGRFKNGVACNSSAFGADPIFGTVKSCEVLQ